MSELLENSQNDNSRQTVGDTLPQSNDSAPQEQIPTNPQMPPAAPNHPFNPNYYYHPNTVPRNLQPTTVALENIAHSPKSLIMVILSLLFGITVSETLFVNHGLGISGLILGIFFYGIVFWYLKGKPALFSIKSLLMTGVSLILLFSLSLHYNPNSHFFDIIVLLLLTGVHLTYLSGNTLADIFSLKVIGDMATCIYNTFAYMDMPFKVFIRKKEQKDGSISKVGKVLIGILIAFPVAIVLLTLFIQADVVFGNSIEMITKYLLIDLGNIPVNIILGTVIALFLSACLIVLKGTVAKQKEQKPFAGIFDNTIVVSFLTIILAVVGIFVAVQFGYLFGGNKGKLPEGYTYAEYARSGFFELTWSCFIVFSIVTLIIYLVRKQDGRLPVITRIMLTLLSLCNGIMLISAVKRMLLYVDVFGLSHKRLLTLWFMAVTAICLVFLILKCLFDGFKAVTFIGSTIILMTCLLCLSNTDYIIARVNVDRYLADIKTEGTASEIDCEYLRNLSYSATPQIARLLDTPARDEAIKALSVQKYQLEQRHPLYGYTFDCTWAKEIYNKHNIKATAPWEYQQQEWDQENNNSSGSVVSGINDGGRSF